MLHRIVFTVALAAVIAATQPCSALRDQAYAKQHAGQHAAADRRRSQSEGQNRTIVICPQGEHSPESAGP